MAGSATVQTIINASVQKVWEFYTTPEHIMKWNNASDDWHTVSAENDLKTGGRFNSRMEAKDGSAGFDFTGVYDEVVENSLIRYTMDDGRKARITMSEEGDQTNISVTFELETENTPELQRDGWQAILDSFKEYVEGYNS